MIYFLFIYAFVFSLVYLYFRFLRKKVNDIVLVGLSFVCSVFLLVAWNFFLSKIFFDGGVDDGVSIVLRSLLSILILFTYSLISYLVLVLYKKFQR